MKINYLVVGLCLVSLIASLFAQQSTTWRDYNGYKWKEYNENRYFSRFLKYSYVISVVLNGKYIRAYIANKLKSVFGEERRSWREINRFLSFFLSDDNYGGVSIRRYVDGLDEFYKDNKNILIPIPIAMTIIKNKAEGKTEDEVHSYIMKLRLEYSESKEEKEE